MGGGCSFGKFAKTSRLIVRYFWPPSRPLTTNAPSWNHTTLHMPDKRFGCGGEDKGVGIGTFGMKGAIDLI